MRIDYDDLPDGARFRFEPDGVLFFKVRLGCMDEQGHVYGMVTDGWDGNVVTG